MIIDQRQIRQVYLVCGKTDLRRGIDGLAGVVQDQFELDPYNQALYWDGDGFLLLYKRIENGRLQWPTNQNALRKLNAKRLRRLLSGWSLDATIHKTCPTGHEK